MVAMADCTMRRDLAVLRMALASDGASLYNSVRSLAESLGASDGGPITVRSGSGLLSSFSSGIASLGVRHGAEGFQAGVQERLTLVAGELDSLIA